MAAADDGNDDLTLATRQFQQLSLEHPKNEVEAKEKSERAQQLVAVFSAGLDNAAAFLESRHQAAANVGSLTPAARVHHDNLLLHANAIRGIKKTMVGLITTVTTLYVSGVSPESWLALRPGLEMQVEGLKETVVGVCEASANSIKAIADETRQFPELEAVTEILEAAGSHTKAGTAEEVRAATDSLHLAREKLVEIAANPATSEATRTNINENILPKVEEASSWSETLFKIVCFVGSIAVFVGVIVLAARE